MLPITIKDQEYTPNLTFALVKRAKAMKDDLPDGFDSLVAWLIDEDPEAIVMFYRLTIGDGKKSSDTIMQALEEAGAFKDIKKTINDIFKGLKDNDFLASKMAHWRNSLIHTQGAVEAVLNKTSKEDTKQEIEQELAANNYQMEFINKYLK